MEFNILFLFLFSLLALGQVGMAVYFWKKEHDFWHFASHTEAKEVKLLENTKERTRRLEQSYEDRFQAVGAKMEQEMAKIIQLAQQEFGKFLASRSTETDKQVTKMLADFTKQLEDKLTSVDNHILKMAQEEEMRAKLESEAYRKKMLDLSQEEVAEVLEKVEKLVIEKGLTLENQTELIFAALDQAKKDAFIS